MTAGVSTVADEQYLTVEDVADRLKVSVWAVRDWLKDGRLVGFQPGGRRVGWRVRESDLQRFVEQSIQQRPDGEEAMLRLAYDRGKAIGEEDLQRDEFDYSHADLRWLAVRGDIMDSPAPKMDERAVIQVFRDGYCSVMPTIPSPGVPRPHLKGPA